MKKLFSYILMSISICFASNSFANNAALTCQSTVGIWKGNLGDDMRNVTLFIEDTGGGFMEDANINFVFDSYDDVEFGLLTGTCIQNPDGSVALNLSRNSSGINATLNTRLSTPTLLNVSYFYFNIGNIDSGSGSGTLTKE